jgi:cobalt-zinc-cadmium resistance protein CzcA
LPVDAFPDVTPVQVNIYTSPGLAAEDVESCSPRRLKRAWPAWLAWRRSVPCRCSGLSYVSVNFKDEVDTHLARRLVSEKRSRQSNVSPKAMANPPGANSSGLGQVFWYTVESADQRMSTMDLRTLQDWNVRLKLRTATGVDDVSSGRR